MRRPSEDRAQPSATVPVARETIRVRGVRVELAIFDEGLEEPDPALLNLDFPVPFLAAHREIRDEIEGTVGARVARVLRSFFDERPVELERLPRTAKELRHERLREGRGTISDAVMEDATLRGAGVPATSSSSGGYGKAPWG